jgi:hypothetical protein
MRAARKKVKGKDCYYHCCARIAGPKDSYLFNDIDREKGMQIVVDQCRLFFIEPISMTWMGNHWHIVLFAPGEVPAMERAAERYNAYYKGQKRPLDPEYDPENCRRIASQLDHTRKGIKAFFDHFF